MGLAATIRTFPGGGHDVKKPVPRDACRDEFASAVYLVFILAFVATLFVELAVVGFDGIARVSLWLLFAIPAFAGFAGIGLVWVLDRLFWRAGVTVARWTTGGMYA